MGLGARYGEQRSDRYANVPVECCAHVVVVVVEMVVASQSEKRIAHGFPVWGFGIVSPGEKHFFSSISIVLKIVCWRYRAGMWGILLGGSFMRRVCQFNFIRKFTSRPEICQCRPSIFRKRGHARFPILVHGMVVGRERRLHFHGRISKIPRRERVLVHGHNFQTVSVVGTLKVWA